MMHDATTTTKPNGKRNFNDAALAVGQTFYDSAAGIRITVNSVSASGAKVRIERSTPSKP